MVVQYYKSTRPWARIVGAIADALRNPARLARAAFWIGVGFLIGALIA